MTNWLEVRIWDVGLSLHTNTFVWWIYIYI